LISHAQKYFNVRQVVYRWSSQYYEPTDGLPYIGGLPGADKNIYVATGYGGNGMIYSHVAAQVLTNRITEGRSVYDEVFSPNRLKPIAGFQEFMRHNADVAKQLIRKIVPAEDLEQFADLSAGEGRVVKLDGVNVAISKDSKGGLHAVSPVCTHMKCVVQWNLAEQSWDCPCHGARFSPDGTLLNGPASADLERILLDVIPLESKKSDSDY
jgi:Rieske Fe-S protein